MERIPQQDEQPEGQSPKEGTQPTSLSQTPGNEPQAPADPLTTTQKEGLPE